VRASLPQPQPPSMPLMPRRTIQRSMGEAVLRRWRGREICLRRPSRNRKGRVGEGGSSWIRWWTSMLSMLSGRWELLLRESLVGVE
jgi:hypothetical protein